MLALTLWLLGWLFSIGLLGVDDFKKEMKLIYTWPFEVGSYIRSKLE